MKLQGDHRICFIGDSFVQGTYDPECRGWVGRVSAAARIAGFDVTAYNLGVRKDTSRDVLARWETECSSRLEADCATHVVFSFGANDMTNEQGALRVGGIESVANFSSILSSARVKYEVLVVGPTPVGEPSQDERILRLCGLYEQAAEKSKVPYLAIARTLATSPLWLREVAANDGSHPGAAGYELIASIVLDWPSWWFKPNASLQTDSRG